MNSKDKFTIELTWYNYKTMPPKDFENNHLVVTNGRDVFGLSWHKAEGYFVLDDYGDLHNLEYEHLDKWYWADVEQTVRNFCREVEL